MAVFTFLASVPYSFKMEMIASLHGHLPDFCGTWLGKDEHLPEKNPIAQKAHS